MPKITPYQLNEYTALLADIYSALEQDVFVRMAELLKAKDEDGKEQVLQWQAEKLNQLRLLNAETINMLAEVTNIAVPEIRQTFARVGYDTIETIDEQIARLGVNRTSQPSEIDSLLQAFVDQTMKNIDNFVNLRLIDTVQAPGTVVNTFKRIIEETTAKVIVGNTTINAAVTATVIKYRNLGLPSGFVDKGGRRWDIQNYVDTAVRSTVNNAYNEIRTSRMDEYGLHLVVVDWYRGARPACAPIQGGVCSLRQSGDLEGYPSIYDFGYGRPDGIRGVNCRHSLIPFAKGISTNNFNPPDVTEANEYYKKQQKQRALEREVRKAKRDLQLAETIGDPLEVKKRKEAVRNRQTLVREYAQGNELPRRYDKERII